MLLSGKVSGERLPEASQLFTGEVHRRDPLLRFSTNGGKSGVSFQDRWQNGTKFEALKRRLKRPRSRSQSRILVLSASVSRSTSGAARPSWEVPNDFVSPP